MEHAAANCYASEPTAEGKITKGCIKSGHTSITEFGDFVFQIDGVSRTLLAQLTRHRMGSYAVRSQRYCDESQFEFVTPPSIEEKGKQTVRIFEKSMHQAQQTYQELVDAGVPKEDARYVLPNACATHLCVKFNFRGLMNFCNERMCKRAQWEIRELAFAMRDLVMLKIDTPMFGTAFLSKYMVPKCEKYDVPFCPEAKSKSCKKHPVLKDLLITEKEDK